MLTFIELNKPSFIKARTKKVKFPGWLGVTLRVPTLSWSIVKSLASVAFGTFPVV